MSRALSPAQQYTLKSMSFRLTLALVNSYLSIIFAFHLIPLPITIDPPKKPVYRGMLRQAPRFGPDIKAQIRDGFRQNKSVKSILQQEYLVRQAEKKLALMKLDTTTGYNPPSK